MIELGFVRLAESFSLWVGMQGGELLFEREMEREEVGEEEEFPELGEEGGAGKAGVGGEEVE